MLLLCAAASLVSPCVARAEPVALTFDDLPTLSLNHDLSYWQVTTERLLRGLRRRRVPAIGFVNEAKLEGGDRAERAELLRRWLDAGMELGNHTYSHGSLSRMPVNAYIGDVERGETVLRPLLAERGDTPRWFRHPYLETGPTLQIRHTFEDWLALHGYRVAPVSLENSDWMFAYPYDDAVTRGDAVAATRIQKEYLAYTAAVIPWYRAAALQLLGRRVPLVFLLHATRLNADSLGQLTAILKANDLKPVSLDQAMQDPIYAMPEDYAGTDGQEWLSRWSLALNKPLPWSSYPQPPADITAAEKRLDPEP